MFQHHDAVFGPWRTRCQLTTPAQSSATSTASRPPSSDRSPSSSNRRRSCWGARNPCHSKSPATCASAQKPVTTGSSCSPISRRRTGPLTRTFLQQKTEASLRSRPHHRVADWTARRPRLGICVFRSRGGRGRRRWPARFSYACLIRATTVWRNHSPAPVTPHPGMRIPIEEGRPIPDPYPQDRIETLDPSRRWKPVPSRQYALWRYPSTGRRHAVRLRGQHGTEALRARSRFACVSLSVLSARRPRTIRAVIAPPQPTWPRRPRGAGSRLLLPRATACQRPSYDGPLRGL